MKRLLKVLKGNGAALLISGALFLFALACSTSPTAPTAVDDSTGQVKHGGPIPTTTASGGDTIPRPPGP